MKTKRPLSLAIVVSSLLVVTTPCVGAASSVTSGWWATTSIPTPPDVPPGGLLVQSTVTPVAYAAVSFVLDVAERPEALTLAVAEGATSNPITVLRACPLTEPLHPAQGGAHDAAPAYDCTQFAEALPTAGQYVFDVSELPTTGVLAVAVLPTGPIDRVVLEAPETGSLSAIGAAGPTRTPPADPGGTPPRPIGEGFLVPPATGLDMEVGELVPPTGTSLAPAPRAAPEGHETSGSSPFRAPSEATTSGLARTLLAMALGTALSLWLTAGRLADNRVRRALRDVATS